MTRWLLIHNFYFWCKINKFISFFSKKQWKSFENHRNIVVDIHKFNFAIENNMDKCMSYTHSYPQVINTYCG